MSVRVPCVCVVVSMRVCVHVSARAMTEKMLKAVDTPPQHLFIQPSVTEVLALFFFSVHAIVRARSSSIAIIVRR